MTRLAWFSCPSGIAGDMALGALLDAGAPLSAVAEAVGRLGLGDRIRLGAEPVQRNGLAATRAVVDVEHGEHDGPGHDGHDHDGHRPWAEIDARLAAAGLDARVEARARSTFRLLAEEEGRLHGVAPEAVEFHEVGSLDAIADVVGVCAALEALGIDEVWASPVAVGAGTARSAHGVLPVPAPATAALLARAGAPSYGVDIGVELATPTGAALLAALARGFGPQPAMLVDAIGYGAGGRELPGRPNVVQVLVGTASGARAQVLGGGPGQRAVELCANVDDATGETLAHAVARLLAAGAFDAWVTPIVMKKGRPGATVHALVEPSLAEPVAAVLVAETGTLGLRAVAVERWPQLRTETVVDVAGVAIRVKLGAGRAKVEHDDAVVAAARLELPLREVLRRAETAAAAFEAHR